jgi:hypothetical protein
VKFTRLRSALVASVSAVIAIATPGGVALAATAKNTAPAVQVSNTLKISPLRTDVTVNPGESGIVKVQVSNLATAPVILQAVENDFVAGDEKGTPSIILDQNSYAPSHSLKRFMIAIPNVTVGAGATEEVSVKIAVPKTAQAGGYFGALRFVPAGSGNQTVDVSGSVVSLILLTVPGPTVEQLTLTNFDVQQSGGTATNFRTPDDLSLLLRFQNKGNLQEAPFGQINVQKGKKVVYTANFNQQDPKDNILPDSARRWAVPIKNLGKFGKYTISGTFGYGTKGQTINIEKTVWIVPTGYIIGGVIAVAVLLVIIVGGWAFLRSYKRRILKSSRRRY